MPNLEIANEKLRKMVRDFQINGFPAVKNLSEQTLNSLTKEQRDVLIKLYELGAKEGDLVKQGVKLEKENKLWRARSEFRRAIQEAICLGLGCYGLIQRHWINYGAIPDPEEKWKYFKGPDGYYSCWNCGSEIVVKTVRCSVHFKELPGAGGGEVRNKEVPYCPKCEKEPPDTGVIEESVADSLEHEMRGLPRHS